MVFSQGSQGKVRENESFWPMAECSTVSFIHIGDKSINSSAFTYRSVL